MWKSAFIALLIPLLTASPAAAAARSEVPAARVAALASRLPEQPKGFGSPCANREAWTAATVERRTADVRKAAEKLLTQDFPPWDQNLYLEYSRDGARAAGERMMNARKAWLYPLVIAECVEGKGRFLPAIEHTILELDTQPTWTWPAHDKGLRNLRDQNFEVDLMAADTAHDLAQALYMLGDGLSPELRQRTLTALNQRAFDPVRKSLRGENQDHFWLRVDHNWNAVCLKGVVAAALTVLPDREDRALFAAGAEVYIRNYVGGFGPDGYSSEGPGYWNYGFSHFAALREMLVEATAGRLDLFADPKIREVALYGYRIEMLPGNIAAFGDAAPNTRMDEFTRAYVNDALGLEQAQHLASARIDPGQTANDAPLAKAALLLFATPRPVAGAGQRAATGMGSSSYFASVGVLVSRPAPGDKLAVSIKAGGNGNHSHNDVGAYTLGLGAEQPVGDVGKTQYSAKTFGPDRYSIPGINSWGHPVPVVAGALQREADKIKPRVISTRFSADADAITIDMADAYSVPALRALTRDLVHDRRKSGSVTITDTFKFATPSTFEVAITTLGYWKQNPDGSLEFWRKNAHVLARIESSAPWTVRAEHSNEEGLSFTRVAIALNGPRESGYVRVRYEPVSP